MIMIVSIIVVTSAFAGSMFLLWKEIKKFKTVKENLKAPIKVDPADLLSCPCACEGCSGCNAGCDCTCCAPPVTVASLFGAPVQMEVIPEADPEPASSEPEPAPEKKAPAKRKRYPRKKK